MPYWRLFYHVTWATLDRQPLLTSDIEPIVHRLLFDKGRELGAMMYAVNGVADHVHLVASIPPRIAVANWVKRLKGSTSRVVNLDAGEQLLRWQPGYGVVSFGQRRLEMVIDYVQRQKTHHDQQSLMPFLEAEDEHLDGPTGVYRPKITGE